MDAWDAFCLDFCSALEGLKNFARAAAYETIAPDGFATLDGLKEERGSARTQSCVNGDWRLAVSSQFGINGDYVAAARVFPKGFGRWGEVESAFHKRT